MAARKADKLNAGPWTIRLEVDEPESKVAAAVDESGTMVGLAAAGVTRDPDAPTAWELYSINVATHHHGTGVAGELITAVIAGRPATLWVVRENTRAQAFYRRYGFGIEGATKAHEGTGVPEIRMVRNV
ncbi:MAG: GNAT family N-acetyltransferase [Actinomycetota bacterium]